MTRSPLLPIASRVLAVCLSAVAMGGVARAQEDWKAGQQTVQNTTAPELVGVDIVEHLGGKLPADAAFRDTEGRSVKLGDYFDGKRPTVLVFAYHTCPMLCSLVLDATARTLNDVAWTVGREFDVVSISIDPKDTPETATRKRAQVVASYTRAHGSTDGWHFLTGDETSIRRVTDAVGFQYNYDPRQKQYAHPAAIYLLTPDGRMARYLYGIQYPASDVRLGLLEAADGHSLSSTDRLLLYCYHYDPQGRKYSLVAMNVMRLGGAVTVVGIGGLLTGMWAYEKRRARASAPLQDSGGPRPAETLTKKVT